MPEEFLDTGAGALSGFENKASGESDVSFQDGRGELAFQQPYDLFDEPNFVRWYSGNSGEAVFEVSKETESSVISGSDECRLIHINVGYDTYGWLVHFDNGLCMGLPDVREYQLRNGSLPSSAGVITYGSNSYEFSGIERIAVYESIRYFSYGA